MTRTIKANNININYRIDGPVDGPVVMLSNSLMSNYSMWDDQVELLTSKYRVLRYDQRGHGGTEVTPAPYSIDLLTEDAWGLMEALGISSVHFVGLSMGGFTGQLLAYRHPEKVSSLTLCDTACVMPPKSLWHERIDIARSNGIEALIDGTLERWFTPPFHQSGITQLDKVRKMILGTNVEGYVGCAAAIRDMNLCDNLPDISVPTLVIVGEDDPACPVSAAKAIYENIPDSKLLVIRHSAHLPNIEQTEAFNSALVNFLDEQQ